jgi:uncharacterized Zn-finger protein
MKTHVDSSQTYPCNICGKEFKRADHRKRHEESHNKLDVAAVLSLWGSYSVL